MTEWTETAELEALWNGEWCPAIETAAGLVVRPANDKHSVCVHRDWVEVRSAGREN